MAIATVELADTGKVPALPENLHDVALVARDLPLRTWAVVVRPDDGPPDLYAAGLANSVAAGEIAQLLTRTYGKDVFIVYRCPTSVTVHGARPDRPGNLCGTLIVDPAHHRQIGSQWSRIMRLQRTADSEPLIIDAMRHAHHLPAEYTVGQVLLHALHYPIDDSAYLTAYIVAAGQDLHRYTVDHHRRERMHRTCPTCGSRVRPIRANVAEAMGNPCNNSWHDQQH